MAYRWNPDTEEQEWYDEDQDAYIQERLAEDPSYGSIEMPELGERAREFIAGLRTLKPLPVEGGVESLLQGEPALAGFGGGLINWAGIVSGLVGGLVGSKLGPGAGTATKELISTGSKVIISQGGTQLSPIPGLELVGPGVPEPPAWAVKRRWETRVYDNRLGYIKLNFYHLVDGRIAMYHNALKYWKVWRLKKPIVLGPNMNLKNVVRVAKKIDSIFGAVETRIKKTKVKRRKRRVC